MLGRPSAIRNLMNLLRFVGWRLVAVAFTAVGVATLVFVLVRLAPGDPVAALLGDYFETATPEQIQDVRERIGVDRPIYEQYLRFLGQVAVGDLGTSFRTRGSVGDEILANLPYTLVLMAAGISLAVIVGVPIGVLAAVNRNGPGDYVAMTGAMLALASPSFWLAILLIYALSFRLGWFPIYGAGDGIFDPRYLVLPAFVVGARAAALIARMTRSTMLEVLGSDYIRTARAKGLPERLVLYRHALGNAKLPIITIIGLDMAFLMSGTVVIETVFARPGVGKLFVDAMFARDYAVIQGVMIVFAVGVAVINALVDIAYRVVDPRLRA